MTVSFVQKFRLITRLTESNHTEGTLPSGRFRLIVTVEIGSDEFTVNDMPHRLDVPAQIIGGSTMLPICAVLESIGYYVEW